MLCCLAGLARRVIRFEEGGVRKSVDDLRQEVYGKHPGGLKIVLVADAGWGKTILSKQLLRELCTNEASLSGAFHHFSPGYFARPM